RSAEETARTTLEQSRAQATAEAESLMRAAREEGLNEGREQGRREVIEQSLGAAREQFAAKATQAASAVETLAAEWQLQRRKLFVDARHDVAALAISIARRIAPRLGELDAAIAADSCGAALGMLGQYEELVIRAHPDDIKAVKQFAEQTHGGM